MVSNEFLKDMEMIIDIIFAFDIILSFFKWTRQTKTFRQIALNYVTGYFIFDFLATVPDIIFLQAHQTHTLNLFRMVHVFKL